MIWLAIPGPVKEMKDQFGNVAPDPYPWEEWAMTSVLNDQAWGKTAKLLLMCGDIELKIEEQLIENKSKYLELTDNEYQEFKKIVETPTSGYNVPVAKQCTKFVRTCLNSIDKNPYEETEEPSNGETKSLPADDTKAPPPAPIEETAKSTA